LATTFGPSGGRVVAEGTPDQLKSAIGGDRLDVVLRDQDDLATAAESRPTPRGA
jgi:ABC-2 type transport system ATP-binding protein